MGDSLYAKTPFIQEALDQGDHFIFTAKTGDHKSLFAHLNEREYSRHDEVDGKGRKFIYEWCHDVPLTKDNDSINVNVMRLRIATPQDNGSQKISYLDRSAPDFFVLSKLLNLTPNKNCTKIQTYSCL